MTEQTRDHAPAPWNWEASGKAGSNGLFNLYITDANGRKIAAVWGKPGEKEATCRMFVAAPELLNGCNALLGHLQLLAARPDISDEVRELVVSGHRVEEARAAIAYATDDGAADVAAPLAPLSVGDKVTVVDGLLKGDYVVRRPRG